MRTRIGAKGQEHFERYLAQWGYAEYEHHPTEAGEAKHPDYLITTPAGEVAAEVKSFESRGLFANATPGMTMSRSQADALQPVRDTIKDAAKQLKGFQGRPLVVVLANPANRPVLLESSDVISAMYGDLGFAFGEVGQLERWQAGRNGRLYVADDTGNKRGNHAYVSAVAVLRNCMQAWVNDWWAENCTAYESKDAALPACEAAWEQAGKPVFTLDVFETVSDRCVPLPADVFFHPGDTRWGEIAPGRYGLRASSSLSGGDGA